MTISTEDDYVLCGQDIAKLTPTCELRLVATHSEMSSPFTAPVRPRLQQKWVASAKMPDGGVWEEHRWRQVPLVLLPDGEREDGK